MDIATTLEQIGISDRDGEQVVLMSIAHGKAPKHYLLGECGGQDVGVPESLYVASGLYRAGTVSRTEGRSGGNVSRVIWLPFDADLLDWLGYPPSDKDARKAMAAELYVKPQPELDEMIAALRGDLEETFAAAGIPIHRLDYTGYGLCAYVYLDPTDQIRIADAKTAHKQVIRALNDRFGAPLIDIQTSDAGTRVNRVPGSINRKGDVERVVTTLVPYTGATMALGMNPAAPRPEAVYVPATGDGLAVADAEWIVAAVKRHWSPGQRHAVAVGLAGLLAKAGVPESQAVALLEAVSDPGDRPQERHRAVESTYARIRNGGVIAGYTTLQSYLPVDILSAIDERLQRYRQANQMRVAFDGLLTATAETPRERKQEITASLSTTPPPAECLVGWVRDYVALMEPLSETPNAFNLACGLTLAGATFGRAISARYIAKSLHANLFMMLVGSAGTSRKDTAIRLALELCTYMVAPLKVHSAPFSVATDVGSAEGLIKILQERPNTLLYITEYQRLSQNAHRQATGTIFNLLTSAWDTPISLQNNTKGSPLEAKFPYLSVLAAVQPGILANEMQQSDMESGYATRWLFVPGAGKEARPEPPDIDDVKAFDLFDRLLRLRKDYESAQNGNGIKFYLSPDAHERWIEWYGQDRKRELVSEDEDSMRSRLAVHVRKLALVYAATAGAGAIGLDHLEPAIAFVEWSWGHTRELMKSWGVGLWSQIENRIEQVMVNHGVITRRDLSRNCRSRRWSSREISQVIDAMLKNQTIVLTPSGGLLWASG